MILLCLGDKGNAYVLNLYISRKGNVMNHKPENWDYYDHKAVGKTNVGFAKKISMQFGTATEMSVSVLIISANLLKAIPLWVYAIAVTAAVCRYFF